MSLYDALLEGNIKAIAEGHQEIAADKKLIVFSVSLSLF